MKQVITMQFKVDIPEDDGKIVRSIGREMAVAATDFMARTIPGSSFIEHQVKSDAVPTKPKPKRDEEEREEEYR